MSKKGGLPDAWDDDYVTQADQKLPSQPQTLDPNSTSRTALKAQHAAANRQLWESAENPQTFHFVEARNNIPLKSDFKPQLQLLSRKPKVASAGAQDESDSEEERRRMAALSLGEKQEQARREREEKQRKYAEVRERLFGSPAPSTDASLGRPASPAGGRNRGVRGGRKTGADLSGRTSRSGSSADHSPARGQIPTRELYDPNLGTKPKSVSIAKRDSPALAGASQPVRQPKGPDGSGRGGFGFASQKGQMERT